MTVKTLPSAGVCRDFKPADSARIPLSSYSDFSVGPSSFGVSDYINPIAIAAGAGVADLVRLLLTHGADYHDLES
ncbi:hypothetical protein RRF57_004832 [Xylaria bambusicola]|uniref:Ankyrin repeat domain-containing protein n=1 Tax=Xylaria bambusicola TaxID=326684 RepID=A0AAN7Z481_9PEZI